MPADLNTPAIEIAFIDTSIHGYAALVEGMREGVELVFIDAAGDGLAQIAAALQGRSGIDAIHVFSHGAPGVLQLGALRLTEAALDARGAELAVLRGALSANADLLLYGCDVAAGSAGAAFLDALARATGADVAASIDASGSALLGGDWTLEAASGAIESTTALGARGQLSFSGLLAVGDENFDGLGPIFVYDGTQLDAGSWRFGANALVDLWVANDIDAQHPLLFDGSPGTDYALLLNPYQMPGATTFSMKSRDGSHFKLDALKFGHSSTDLDTVVIEGYANGVRVVSGETVNLRASDATGNIHYNVTYSDIGWRAGQLTFGAAFADVDEIRFVFSETSDMFIDDIEVSPAVDSTAPKVFSVSAPSSGNYTAGQVLGFTVVFDENVIVTGTASTLGVDIGGVMRSAAYASKTANTVTYTYTIQAGDTDADGVVVGTLALNGSTIRDAAGNDAVLTLNGVIPTTGVRVDTTAPAVAGNIAVPANGSYAAGQALVFTVTLSENVTVTGTDSTLGLTIGSTARSASYLSKTANSISYSYTVQAGDLDADGIVVGNIALGASTVRDGAGNTANLSLSGHRPATTGILVDAAAPALSGTITAPANGTYAAGDTLAFTLHFDESVVVSGTGSLLGLTIGSTARSASFVAASGNSVSYAYTVQAGDVDADGIAIAGLSLNGSTIRDAAGNNANLALSGHLPVLTGVLVDTVAPAVSGNLAVPANGSYGLGDVLAFTVTFDENITVNGADSTLGLTIGSTSRSATLTAASANSLTYAYTVQAGDLDANGIAVGSIALGTSTVRDAAGNNANLSLAGHLPALAGILVDTVAPSVASVAVPANALYAAGQQLEFTVNFDENVVVSGSDSTLGLTIGSTARSASFVASTGNTVSYRYTVQAGDMDSDGIAIGAIAPGASSFRDAAGNAANLNLAGNLPSLAGVLVDGTVPAIAGTITAPANGTYSAGGILEFTVYFDENVTLGGNASTLGLDIGGVARSASVVANSDNSITYRYVVQAGDSDADGVNVTGIALGGGSIRDSAGNNANLALTGHLPSLAGVLVDASAPVVQGTIAVPADGSYRAGDVLGFTIGFDEDITVSGNDSSLALTIGSTGRSAAFHSSTSNSLTYTYTVQAGDLDTDGIAIGSIALGTSTIQDAVGNDANLALAGHLPATSGIRVDTIAPGVSGTVIVPEDATYGVGQDLDFTVNFNENVVVSGSDSTLALVIGGNGRSAEFLWASDNAITYRYTVQAGDLDADGIAIGAIAAGSSSIRDAAGNNANLQLAGHLPATTGILVDGSAPAVSGTIAAPNAGSYRAGQHLDFTVGFSEGVIVTGTASMLGLDIGGTQRSATFLSKTADSITYRYTVQAGDNDANGIAVTSLALNGGSIQDSAGNHASLALAGHLPALGGVRVDTAAPSLSTATVNGTALVLRFLDANALDAAHPPSPASFTVNVGGSAAEVSGVVVDPAALTVTLTLTRAVANGQAVTVAYTGGIRDAAGNDAAGFAATAVGNNTPAPSNPSTGSSSTVDGVPVFTTTFVQGDGTIANVVTVPIVSSTRVDQVGGNNVADIPLVTNAGGSVLLGVQVPAGAGLQASGGAPKAAGDALTDLIREITAHAGSASLEQISSGGTGFVGGLAAGTQVLVQTIVPTGTGGTAGAPLAIFGQPQGSATVQTALVIDTRGLPAGTTLTLDNVDFAALIGAVNVSGGAGSQKVWGDSASQSIFLGADDDVLHGGGGDDIVGSAGGNDQIYGDDGNDLIFGGEGNDYLDGGSGHDTARYTGRSDNYSLRLKDGKLVITDRVGMEGTDTVVGVETLRFTGDQSMANDAVLARLYDGLLQRQASHAEIAWWQEAQARGASMHDIAASILASNEGAALHRVESDAAFIASLYQSVLGRAAGQEASYWTGVLAQGVDRATVALGFVNSTEKLASAHDLDFNHSEVAALVRMYHAMFGRGPDEGGLNYWLERLEGGVSIGAVADAFAGSAEVRAQLQQDSDAGFISLLYRTALERAPTANELQLLLGQLHDGVFDRGQVLLNVAESSESVAIVGSVNTDLQLM